MPKPTERFVHPGGMCFGDEAICINTTLGSCIAIVAWHPSLRIGGLSHYMLPGHAGHSGKALDGRYSENALELLIREFRKLNIALSDCHIKLFGGGSMSAPSKKEKEVYKIGLKNVEEAHSLMRRYQLTPVAEHLGGNGYRKLKFNVKNGDVQIWHHRLRSLAA